MTKLKPNDPVWYAPDRADLGKERNREYAAVVDSDPYELCGTTVVRIRYIEHEYARRHGGVSALPVAVDNLRPREVVLNEVTDAWLASIREALHTQDNRATQMPIFIVEQKRRIFGVSDDYAEHFDWVDEEQEVISDANLAAQLEEQWQGGDETEPYRRIGYVEIYEHVTSCLTEYGCKDYLRRNAHNLIEPRIYVASGHRNEEWATLRRLLMYDERTAPADPHAHRRLAAESPSALLDTGAERGD